MSKLPAVDQKTQWLANRAVDFYREQDEEAEWSVRRRIAVVRIRRQFAKGLDWRQL